MNALRRLRKPHDRIENTAQTCDYGFRCRTEGSIISR
jgi:hypothetical protein